MGIRPGDRVLLLVSHIPDFFRAFWGCVWAGATPVPLAGPRAASPEELGRVRRVIDMLGGPVVVDRGGRLPSLDLLDVGDLLDGEPIERGPAVGPALIQFSSGSTRAPRGVVLEHDQLLFNIEQLAARVPLSPADVMLTWMPHFHDMGLIGCHILGLCLGVVEHRVGAAEAVLDPLRWLATASHSDTATDDVVEELVGLLDGSPLGVELAAARVRLLRPNEMVHRLREGAAVLGVGTSPDARHRSIDGLVRGSWEDLDDELREALLTLSAFGGTLESTAAEHLLREVTPGSDPLSTLDGLFDRSLIRLSGTRPQRLLVYRAVREFAARQLTEGEAEARRSRVARSLGNWGASMVRKLMGPQQERVAAALELDLPFIEHACLWTLEQDPDAGVQLLYALAEHSWTAGLSDAAQRLSALAVARDLGDPLTSRDVRLIRSAILFLSLQPKAAEELLEGLDYGPVLPWRRCLREYLFAECVALRSPAEALRRVENALELGDGGSPRMRVLRARALTLRARLRTFTVEPDLALADLREARRAWGDIGSRSGEGAAYMFQGTFEANLRRNDDAIDSLTRALSRLDGLGARRQQSMARTALALVHQDRGELDVALDVLGDSPGPQEYADVTALHHVHRGGLWLEKGDIDAAERDLLVLRAMLGDDADPFYVSHACTLDAQIGRLTGDRRRVLRACARARKSLRAGSVFTAIGATAVALMMVAAEAGETEKAEALAAVIEAEHRRVADLRALTAMVPLRAAFAFGRGRAASDESEVLRHRKAARDILRAGRRAPSIHEPPALACAEARLALAGLEAATDSRGDLISPPTDVIRQGARIELDAWLALIG